MGDTGALALGGGLGAVAILLKSEFVLAFVGALFVAEMMSVHRSSDSCSSTEGAVRARVRADSIASSTSAAPSSLRRAGLEGIAGRRALLDHRHPLRVRGAEHAEAAMTPKTVRARNAMQRGRTARSRSSVSHGADAPPRSCSPAPARRSTPPTPGSPTSCQRPPTSSVPIGVDVQLGGHDLARIAKCGLVVASPGVPPDAPPFVAAREAGVPIVSEIEIGLRFLPDLNVHRDHRHQRQDDDDRPHRPSAESARQARRDRGQHRHAADRARALAHAARVDRARGVVVSAARHAEHPADRRHGDEPLGQSPRPVRQRRRVLRRQGAPLPEREHRVELGEQPRRPRRPDDGRARRGQSYALFRREESRGVLRPRERQPRGLRPRAPASRRATRSSATTTSRTRWPRRSP